MNQFRKIDSQLKAIAKEIGATLETTVGGHSINGVEVPKEKLAIRQFKWVDGPIGKAIIINQNFDKGNMDAPNWDFFNIAWLQEGKIPTKGRPFWKKNVLTNIDFKQIETNIDQLLKQSLDNLKSIQKKDLKYQ